eukprot:gene42574-34141_t
MAAARHLFVIHALDDLTEEVPNVTVLLGVAPGQRGGRRRMAAYPQHKAYQQSVDKPGHPGHVRKVAAGPLVEPRGGVDTVVGSLLIVDATEEEARRYVAGDPFQTQGVWRSVRLS